MIRRGLLLVCTLWAIGAVADTGTGAGFEALLRESQLILNAPDGYAPRPAARTPVLDYEYALRSPNGELELRLAIRPIQRLRIDYDDPHGAVPDPNHIFPLVFESLSSRLAAGGHSPSNPYPPEQARAKFNADWAAASVFDVSPEFSEDYPMGLLLAIHRNLVADAYVVFLFADYEKVRTELTAALDVLRFAGLSSDPGVSRE